MYYIYHIPGVKIGCSTEPNIRVKNQGYTDFEILEQSDDIYKISEREMLLQKQYGYRVDRISYVLSYKRNKPHKLTLKEQQYIHKHYFKGKNQFTKIPNGKFNIPQLAAKFNVTKKMIADCLKRDISQMLQP